MLKQTNLVPAFTAGDLTQIRELLHPANDPVQLSYSLAHGSLSVGSSSLPHRLLQSSELYYFLIGSGVLVIESERYPVAAGDAVLVRPGQRQHLENTGGQEILFLCIVSPPWSVADEVIVG